MPSSRSLKLKHRSTPYEKRRQRNTALKFAIIYSHAQRDALQQAAIPASQVFAADQFRWSFVEGSSDFHEAIAMNAATMVSIQTVSRTLSSSCLQNLSKRTTSRPICLRIRHRSRRLDRDMPQAPL